MMDHGPAWPPREPPAEPAPRRRPKVPMLRPFPLAVRAGALTTLLALFAWACLHGYVRTVRMDFAPEAPHAATSFAVAGHGHHAHRHTP